MIPHFPHLVAALLLGTQLAACSGAPPRSAPAAGFAEQVITSEMIRGANVATGWQVLQRYASHLALSEHPERGSRIARRGKESILLREEPLLVVDGTVSHFSALHTLAARELASIRILTGTAGTTRYGMRAASGVILVQTERGIP